jgi:hypothetical protein
MVMLLCCNMLCFTGARAKFTCRGSGNCFIGLVLDN